MQDKIKLHAMRMGKLVLPKMRKIVKAHQDVIYREDVAEERNATQPQHRLVLEKDIALVPQPVLNTVLHQAVTAPHPDTIVIGHHITVHGIHQAVQELPLVVLGVPDTTIVQVTRSLEPAHLTVQARKIQMTGQSHPQRDAKPGPINALTAMTYLIICMILVVSTEPWGVYV